MQLFQLVLSVWSKQLQSQSEFTVAVLFADSFSLSNCLPHLPLFSYCGKQRVTLQLGDAGASFKINLLLEIDSFV